MFPKVKTVFSVNGVVTSFDGTGENTINAAKKAAKDRFSLKLLGFNIDNVFVEAELFTTINSNRIL